MKRLLIFIVGAFLLATAVIAVAAEKPIPFNPQIHNQNNLPAGILYMEHGTVYFVTNERLVVNDANFPFRKATQVFTPDGLKISRKNLKKGQKVDVYANDKHEAVYVVIK
jgi:hypothetical protein